MIWVLIALLAAAVIFMGASSKMFESAYHDRLALYHALKGENETLAILATLLARDIVRISEGRGNYPEIEIYSAAKEWLDLHKVEEEEEEE